MLDPANYGSLAITHGVSIEGHGWASIAPVTGSAAITINALGATNKINIIWVVLDGTAVANTNGIVFNSGGTLTVRDSVIRNFNGDGIDFLPNTSSPAQLIVSNTLVSDNKFDGIFLDPIGSVVSGILKRVEMQNNGGNGLSIQAPSTISRDPRCDAASTEFGCFEELGAPLIVLGRQPQNSVISAEHWRRLRSQQHKLQPLASWKR